MQWGPAEKPYLDCAYYTSTKSTEQCRYLSNEVQICYQLFYTDTISFFCKLGNSHRPLNLEKDISSSLEQR